MQPLSREVYNKTWKECIANVRIMLRRFVDGEMLPFDYVYSTVYYATLCWPDRPSDVAMKRELREAAQDAMALIEHPKLRLVVADTIFLKYTMAHGIDDLRATPADIERLVAEYTAERDRLVHLCYRDMGGGAGLHRQWAAALDRWRAGGPLDMQAGCEYAEWKAQFAEAELVRAAHAAALRRVESFLARRTIDF